MVVLREKFHDLNRPLMSTTIIKSVCRAMERIAPLRLAAKWDNVGLLLESPCPRPNANNVLLTIDITPAVCIEALASPTSVIISYHPPIFKPLTSITLANPLQSSLLKCAAGGVSIYSPHTALDSIWGGVNDWLAQGLLGGHGSDGGQIRVLAEQNPGSNGQTEGGEGRLVTLKEPIDMKELEKRVLNHLRISQIQVGYAATKDIRTVAICAGSGGSLLLGHSADVYFTGEMSHHEVLAALAGGTHVVLCGHTNTERGYLPILAAKLRKELDADSVTPTGIQVCVSAEDKHPLQFVPGAI